MMAGLSAQLGGVCANNRGEIDLQQFDEQVKNGEANKENFYISLAIRIGHRGAGAVAGCIGGVVERALTQNRRVGGGATIGECTNAQHAITGLVAAVRGPICGEETSPSAFVDNFGAVNADQDNGTNVLYNRNQAADPCDDREGCDKPTGSTTRADQTEQPADGDQQRQDDMGPEDCVARLACVASNGAATEETSDNFNSINDQEP